MPKRVIDGEGLWRSDKLAKVEPPAYRAEYANLVPLALANGSFECTPRLIWSRAYAYNRPDVTPEMVALMLAEFERVKLLFRWRDKQDREWGYWTGIEKAGRLPAASRQKHEIYGEQVPTADLAKFLNISGQPMDSHRSANGSLGLGLGSGIGLCSCSGGGEDTIDALWFELTEHIYNKPEKSAFTMQTYALLSEGDLDRAREINRKAKLYVEAKGNFTVGLGKFLSERIFEQNPEVWTNGNGNKASREARTRAIAEQVAFESDVSPEDAVQKHH